MLSGGKFANGAITAAFALMYNDWQHGQKGQSGTQSGIDERAFAQRTEGNGIEQSYFLENAAMMVGAPAYMLCSARLVTASIGAL